uniref:Peptidase C1A papain C-terminal domain-containing protein n=2 Tax=Lotharella oceanica TaxID=641309 RepID=A0A7S2TWX8_9EUKA|mmetsp:Transcript_30701/g.57366  ORF Transcript_30701/g.57366 Transcript_30701/m.57366 type:complete len:369 (+) Transcript_30701:81-1187(+)
MRLAATLLLPALASTITGYAFKHDAIRGKEIERLNLIPGMTWKAGFNDRFKGLPLNASKELCGVKPGNFERMQELIRNGTIKMVNSSMLGAEGIPTDFDSETNWPECAKVIGDIRDQSNCGCCWAFGAAEAASDRLCIATGGKVKVPLSSQEMCFCAESDGCGGGFLDLAWSYIARTGLVTGGQYNGTGPFGTDAGFCSAFSLPHCHHHGPQGSDPYPDEGAPGCPSASSPACPKTCDSGAKTPYDDFSSARYTYSGRPESYPSEKALQEAIMTNGPVETAFTVYSDFENYVSGVYQRTSSQVLGGHAVRIVGWGVDSGVKYWKVANSWNPYWGEKGYFRIIRGRDECGIESQAMASPAKAEWSGPGI